MNGPAASPPRRAPSFAGAALRVFDLSLGELLWSKRTIFLALVSAGPIALGAILRALERFGGPGIQVNAVRVGGSAVFGGMIWLLYLRFLVPVVGAFYGTALIADEVEDKTVTYLFTRPIPRGAVAAGKYLAYLVCTTLVVLPSVMLVYFIVTPIGGGSIGETFPALLVDLALLGLGLSVYGALFAFIGAALKRPLAIGLVFAFGWEPAVLLFPGYLKRLTVAYYLQALVPHAMPQDSTVSALLQLFREVPAAGSSLVWMAAISAVFIWLAARAVERREYVLEQ